MSQAKQNSFLHFLWVFCLSVKHWLINQVEHSFAGRLIYWVPVLFGGGILIYFATDSLPPISVLFLSALLLASFVWLSFTCQRRWLAGLFAALLIALLGLIWISVKTQTMDVVLLNKETGVTKISGLVEDVEANDKGRRVVLNDLVYEQDLIARNDLTLPNRIRLQSYHADDLISGMRVEVLASLMPPAAPSLPGGFDFRRYAFYRNIGAVGFTLSEFEILAVERRPVSQFFTTLREEINAKLAKIEDDDQRGVAMALLTGERSAVPEDTLEAIRDAGIAHLLAISGLHVGLVAGFIFLVVRLLLAAVPSLALYWPIKKIAAIFGLAAAVFYMLLVGAPMPTQRAVIMTGVVFIAILFDRNAISFRLAALAAMFVLLIRPQSVVEVSFQLSFAAVLSLIAFYTFLRKRYSHWMYSPHLLMRPMLYVWGVILTTLIASLATAPLTFYHFQHFASYSHLSNLVAVPLTSFVVMPIGVIAMLLMPFGFEGVVLPLIEQGIDSIVETAYWVAGLHGAVLKTAMIPPQAISVFVLGGLVLLLCRLSVLSVGLFTICVIASTFFWWQVEPRPNVFIDREAELVGVVEEGQLSVTSLRKNKYGQEQWLSSLGWKPDRAIQNQNCDEWGCVWDVNGYKISWVAHLHGLSIACEQSDIVIYSGWLNRNAERQCEASLLIDKRKAREEGATALHLDRHIKKHTVDAFSLSKPWTQ